MISFREFLNESKNYTGKHVDDLVNNLKKDGFEIDSADLSDIEKRPKHINSEKITLFKNKVEYKGTFNRYSDGGLEIVNIKKV